VYQELFICLLQGPSQGESAAELVIKLTGAGQRMQVPVSIFGCAGQHITVSQSAYANAGQRTTAPYWKARGHRLSSFFLP
jgi:hypothetical protein